jgi:hypothetical protein
MIDQVHQRLGWRRGEVIAQWKGDIDEVLADAQDKLASGTKYIHSYQMDLERKVRDLSKAKKVMNAGKEVHPPTTEGRDPRDVINNFLKQKEQRSERGQKLYTDREFQQDMAAVKAGKADPGEMADKWGERGGAFLNFIRNEAEVGDKVKYRNIKTKRRKTGTVQKVDTKNGQKRYELDGGKMVYDADLEEAFYKDGTDDENTYTVVNTKVNKRVGHGKLFKSAERAQEYLDNMIAYSKKGWDNPAIQVMSIADAKSRGVESTGGWKHVPWGHPIEEAGGKIACLKCDAVSTAAAWKKNNGFCPKCKTSSQGVAEGKEDGRQTASAAVKRDNAARQRNIRKAKSMMKRGFSAEKAAKEYGVRVKDLQESEPTDSDYAIGMAQAKKSTGDKPPLDKSTIRKAHKIAKAVAKESASSGRRMPTHEIMNRIERAMPDLKPYGVKEKVLGIVSDILYKADQGILEDSDPCWKGYRQLGMKKKNGKEVPNCVPESEEVEEGRRFKTAYGWAGGSKEPTKREIAAQRKRAEKRRKEREARSKEQSKVDEAMPSFGKLITVSKGGKAVKQIKMQDGVKMHHLARELRAANLGLRDLDLTNAARELARGKPYSAGDVELTVGEHKPRQFEGTSYERGLDPNQTIVVRGIKGMDSKPFRKRFRNEQAFNRWADSEAAGDYEVHQVTNEKAVAEKEGGMSDQERKSYNRKHGSNLKRAQPGGGKRRTSYCARSKGQMDDHNIDCRKDPDKPICKARRDWNC